MARNALGLIEVVGMTAAIVAADTAVKSANVRLLGYENSKGGGMITVKFEGDVGAVKAALESASVEASKVNRIVSKHLIPRPSDAIQQMTIPKINAQINQVTQTVPEINSENDRNQSVENQEAETDGEKPEEIEKPKEIEEEEEIEEIQEEPAEKKSLELGEQTEDAPSEFTDQEVCNICKDPACTRRKGDARTMCIHYHATIGGK